MTANDKATCPKCGREIGRGLAGHQGSKQCFAYREQDKAEERGLTQVFSKPQERSRRLLELIDKYGELKTYKTAYKAGSRNKRSQLYKRYYADPEAIRRAAREYLPNPRDNATRAEIIERVKHDGNQWLVIVHETTSTCLFTNIKPREDLQTGDGRIRELLAVRIERPSNAEHRHVVYLCPPKQGRDKWRTDLCAYTCHGELVGSVEPSRTVVVDAQTANGTLRIDNGNEVRGFDHDKPGMIDLTAHVAVSPGRVITRDAINPGDVDPSDRTARVANLSQHGDAIALTDGGLIRLSKVSDEYSLREEQIAQSYEKSTTKMRPAAVTAVQLGDQLVLESATLSGTTTEWER